MIDIISKVNIGKRIKKNEIGYTRACWMSMPKFKVWFGPKTIMATIKDIEILK